MKQEGFGLNTSVLRKLIVAFRLRSEFLRPSASGVPELPGMLNLTSDLHVAFGLAKDC